ncbi:sirohydrochlorin chelatase [Paenibacillus chitinolyticus]|uniref:sirohydrochlorin chelatase n=1 Tax=Paenibacillus chitinolyticus TaxID=79263 RepID=UPI00366C0021
MDAVLFVGHGSRDAEGNSEVRAFVSRLAETMEQGIIETCFLELEKPTISQGIQTCVNRGATRIAVVPIILFSAGHAKIHIPGAIDEAKERYPGVQFIYGRPIGVHEGVVDIMTARLGGADRFREETPGDTAVLVVGRGSSDPDANSELFKISRLLWEKLQVPWVETAFIGVTAPLLENGIERCLRLGAKKVIVLPYFLFTGILIKRMEGMLLDFSLRYPDCTFEMTDYFGLDPILGGILRDRAGEALQDEVKMNCDMCSFRLEAMKHIDHHHHHDHDHDHDHHHHHDHHHGHHHDHDHDHGHEHEHRHEHVHGHTHDHDHDHAHHDHDHAHGEEPHTHGHVHDHGEHEAHAHNHADDRRAGDEAGASGASGGEAAASQSAPGPVAAGADGREGGR